MILIVIRAGTISHETSPGSFDQSKVVGVECSTASDAQDGLSGKIGLICIGWMGHCGIEILIDMLARLDERHPFLVRAYTRFCDGLFLAESI